MAATDWPEYDGETDDQRLARFAPLNDQTWGEGNWIECPTCPPDDRGKQPFHHKEAHS